MRKYFSAGIFFLLVFISSYTFAQEEGRKTASGEPYDKNKLTGAHKTLEFGTIVKVTRLDNKKSVNIRINDRGPYIKGRIVDVSKAAAQKLDLITDGRTEVKVEVVGKGISKTEEEPPITANNQPNLEALRVNEPPAPTVPEEEEIPNEFSNTSAGIPTPPKGVETATKSSDKPKKTKAPDLVIEKDKVPQAKPTVSTSKAPRVISKNYSDYDLYKIQLLRPERKGYGVQVASLTKYENVMKQVAQLQEEWFNNILVSVERGAGNKPIYKLILGPFEDRGTAESYKKQLKKKKNISGFVVDLAEIKY